jgi:hypothetical protein
MRFEPDMVYLGIFMNSFRPMRISRVVSLLLEEKAKNLFLVEYVDENQGYYTDIRCMHIKKELFMELYRYETK